MSCQLSMDDGQGGTISWPLDGTLWNYEGDTYNVNGDCSTTRYTDGASGPNRCDEFNGSELTCTFVQDGVNYDNGGGSSLDETGSMTQQLASDVGGFLTGIVLPAVLALVLIWIAFRMATKYLRKGAAA